MHSNRRIVVLWIALAGWLGMTEPGQAREATVTTNSGRQYTGEVESDNEKGIKLIIAGIPTSIAREDVSDVTYKLTLHEQYMERRPQLKDNDVDGRYKLALWLYEQKGYLIAQQELGELAKRFPDDARVKRLHELVATRIKLHKQPPATVLPKTTVKRKPRPATDVPRPTQRTTPNKYNRLSPEQINIIKVYEIDLGARREPKIVIDRDVIKEFVEQYADQDRKLRGRKSQQEFMRASGARQLRTMFALKARDFYGRVDVREDPPVMADFKKEVHRNYVLNYCGTTQCHGGPDAGEFKLVPHRATSDETVYTNFYQLNQWQRGEGYMIDRDQPRASYLVQYGLPRGEAKFPHPGEVKGWKPYLLGRSNRTYRNLLDWIDRLYRPVPKYPIEFELKRVVDVKKAPAKNAATAEPADQAPPK